VGEKIFGESCILSSFIICAPQLILRVIKSRNIRWARHVACMRKIINAYAVLIGKPQAKRTLGR
jgi:hypothetical protein